MLNNHLLFPPDKPVFLLCHQGPLSFHMNASLPFSHWSYLWMNTICYARVNLPSCWPLAYSLSWLTQKETPPHLAWSKFISPPLAEVLLSTVLVTPAQPKTIKWKILGRNKSSVLNCPPFWVAWCNPMSFRFLCPGCESPLSSVSTLSTLLTG